MTTKAEAKLRAAAFADDLLALLEKHKASIGVGYADCSDTHGMYDEHMSVDFDDGVTVRLSDNWGLDVSDLKRGR